MYTSKRAAALLGKEPKDTNVIICHIGNGASCCAVKNGKCYDTTMGLTPLDGLVMGTRSGTVDPALPFYIMRKTGMSADEMDKALNKKSGLLGITGKYTDRRDIEKGADEGDELCKLGQEMEGYRIKKTIGAYMAAIGNVDAIIFTAGVGEHSPKIRALATEGLECMGIKLDEKKNNLSNTSNAETIISSDDSKVKIFVIPTDEELVMTEDAYAIMKGTYDVHTNFTYSFQAKDYVNKARESALVKEIEKNPELKSILAR